MPMWEQSAYVDALARLTRFWRAVSEGNNRTVVPREDRERGVDYFARGPWIVEERAPPIKDVGYELLHRLDLGGGRTIRKKPDWERLRERVDTLHTEMLVGALEPTNPDAVRSEFQRVMGTATDDDSFVHASADSSFSA